MISYDRLFALMKEKDIKKVDLRNKYKLNPKTVDSLVKGESVTVHTLCQLCKILNCNIADIVEYIPDDTEKTQS